MFVFSIFTPLHTHTKKRIVFTIWECRCRAPEGRQWYQEPSVHWRRTYLFDRRRLLHPDAADPWEERDHLNVQRAGLACGLFRPDGGAEAVVVVAAGGRTHRTDSSDVRFVEWYDLEVRRRRRRRRRLG